MQHHQPLTSSVTLGAAPSGGAGITSAEPPTGPGSGVRAFHIPPDLTKPAPVPPPVIDQFGRDWQWRNILGAYRHDNGCNTLLSEQSDICGNVFEWVWAHSQASDLARRVLLELAWTPPIEQDPTWPGYTSFWSLIPPWERSTPNQSTDWGSPTCGDLAPIEQAVIELVTLGELDLHNIAELADTDQDLSQPCPEVTYTFPAYQAWCDREATR